MGIVDQIVRHPEGAAIWGYYYCDFRANHATDASHTYAMDVHANNSYQSDTNQNKVNLFVAFW